MIRLCTYIRQYIKNVIYNIKLNCLLKLIIGLLKVLILQFQHDSAAENDRPVNVVADHREFQERKIRQLLWAGN